METVQPTVELIEDCLLEFLDITQMKFSHETFPPNIKSKWLQFKQANYLQISPMKKLHNSSKSQTEVALKPRLYSQEKRDSTDFPENKVKVGKEFISFTNHFKNLMRTVNDNTKFYENLAFKQNGEGKYGRGEGIDPLNFYMKNELLVREKK